MKKMRKESAKNSSSFAPAKSRAITVKVTITSDYGKEIAVEEEFNVPRGWDDPFYEYIFAGGTRVESEIPLDLEEFYKMVR